MARLAVGCAGDCERRDIHMAAVNEEPVDPRFRDPLSEVTRKERRFLLAISMGTIVLTSLHEKITKIPLIEIETDGLSADSQQKIMAALAAVILYALVAFVVYAWADFVAWRQTIAKSDTTMLSDMLYPVSDFTSNRVFGEPSADMKERIKTSLDLAHGRNSKWTRRVRSVAYLRAVWDFLLPISLGAVAAAMAGGRALTIC